MWTNRPNVHFFGIETDVHMATYLSTVILDALDSETAKFQRTDTYRRSVRRRFMTASFKAGMVRRLADRIATNTPTGKGIVLHKLAYVHDELARQMPELQFRKRPQQKYRISKDAFAAGEKAGDRVNLNRPVGARQTEVAGYLP